MYRAFSFEAVVLTAFALFLAIVVLFASTIAHAATPVETCPKYTGWHIAMLAIAIFVAGNLGFLTAALFHVGGRS